MKRKRNSIDMHMSLFCKESKFDKDERLSRRLNRRSGIDKSTKVDVNNSGVNTSLDDSVDHDTKFDKDERLSRCLNRRSGIDKSAKVDVNNSGVNTSLDDYEDHDKDERLSRCLNRRSGIGKSAKVDVNNSGVKTSLDDYVDHDTQFDKDERLSRRLNRRLGVHKSAKVDVNNFCVNTSLDDYVDHDTEFDKDERLSSRLNRRFGTHKSAKVDVNNSGVNTSLDDSEDHDKKFDKDEKLSRRLSRRSGIHKSAKVDVNKSGVNTPLDDYVDHDKDERLSRRLNRRSGIHKSAKVDVNNSGVNTSLDDYVDYDDDDPDYLTFLKHLRENGNSYILEIAWTDDEMPLRIIYEKDDEFFVDDDVKPINLKRFKDVPSRDSVKTKRVLRSSGKNKENPGALKNVPNKKRKISSTVKDVKLEHGVKVNATQKARLLMREVKQEMGSAMEEEDYFDFLKCLEQDGDSLVMVAEDGKRTKYEEDDENPASDSDLDIEVIEVDPQPLGGTPSPFVTSKIYYHDCKGFSSSINSKFREKLTDILRKPFDQKEYEELYKDAFERKPVERCRELRSGTKRCVILEDLGKSYIDHHPDLKNEILSVSHNRYMVLKLLRGFFFWLKNVSQDGGFRPWLDKSSLEQIRQR